MATVSFSIDLREDAKNWVRVAKLKRPTYGRSLADLTAQIPPTVLRTARSLPRGRAITFVHHYLEGRQDRFLTDLRAMKALHEEYFRRRGTALLNTVARLVNRPIYTQRFSCTFTLLSTCPYDPERNWFMVSAKANMPSQLRTVCHEVLHLQFIHYYYRYCRRQLNEKQFQDLKEALTVLLNEPRFRRFHVALDPGYAAHAQLRTTIQRLWRRRRSFPEFLDRSIDATRTAFPA